MIDIPLIDIRADGPRQLVRDRAEQAKHLVAASRKTLGPVSDILSYAILPVGDRLSRDWLIKSANPYFDEIEYAAAQLATPGIHALNVCFEWGCTSSVYTGEGEPVLTRAMDWAFPKLGENLVVAFQSGAAGDFYNVTWPGLSGMFQGMAPGRFAASLNQAPMQRHRLTYVGDWLYNRRKVFRASGLPPAHLLRQTFEEARNYAEAKERLSKTPVALPVTYILSGTKRGEGCVIERTENDFAVREISNDRVCAANHFETGLNDTGYGWRPRPFNSLGRASYANAVSPHLVDDKFSWFQKPVANSHTRLAMTACAAKGALSVFGTNGEKPVTNIFYKRG